MKNIAKIIPICVFLLLPHALFSQDVGFSLGLGADINLISLDEPAIGGKLEAEYAFTRFLSAGIRGEASYSGLFKITDTPETNPLFGIEAETFMRLYLPGQRAHFASFFFQAGGGLLVTQRGMDQTESRGAPEAGIALGLRFFMPKNWYLDLYARGGYPYAAGAGILVGRQFEKPKPQIIRETTENERPVQNENIFFNPIVFAADRADFFGLAQNIITTNDKTLDDVATRFPLLPSDNHLLIVGTANPVLRTAREESNALRPLSMARANMAYDLLVKRGVDKNRIITAAAGSSWPLASALAQAEKLSAVAGDKKYDLMANRRVEFIVIDKDNKDFIMALIDDAAHSPAEVPAEPPKNPPTLIADAELTAEEVTVEPAQSPPTLAEILSQNRSILTNTNSKKYRVVRGDSLVSITRRFYGKRNVSYFPLILLANPSMKRPSALAIGMTLTIPDIPANARGNKERRTQIYNYFIAISDFYQRSGSPKTSAVLRAAAKDWK